MFKGTYFCDLDGTLFKHGTTEFLPGAKEFLELASKKRWRIIFTTRRGDVEFEGHPVYSKHATEEMLFRHGLDRHTIVYDVMSPRIIVDDSEVGTIRRYTNQGFSEKDLADLEKYGTLNKVRQGAETMKHILKGRSEKER